MADKVLCVDDDENILRAYQRTLHKRIHIDTALGGEEGMRSLIHRGPYAVIVADMNMPGMTGVEFLAQAREVAPDSVRMMLSGTHDQHTAIAAVNEGNIFRFLTKPCQPEVLAKALEAGIRQYQLITAERELLEKTLKGSIALMSDILALVDSDSTLRTEAMRRHVRPICALLPAANPWEVEMAAMLARIGHVTIPPSVMAKVAAGQPLDAVEQDMLWRVPENGAMLLANIPRLENVARIVLYQAKDFDGGGFPADSTSGEAIPLGARVLRFLVDLVASAGAGTLHEDTLALLRTHAGRYDPQVIDAALRHFTITATSATSTTAAPTAAVASVRQLTLRELRCGQILRSHVLAGDGRILVAAGHVVSSPLLERLGNFARLNPIKEPLTVEG